MKMPKIPTLVKKRAVALIRLNLESNNPTRIFFPKVTKTPTGLHIDGEMEVWNENEVAMKNLVGFEADVPFTYPDGRMNITTDLPEKRAKRLQVPEFIEEAIDQAIDNAAQGKIVKGEE